MAKSIGYIGNVYGYLSIKINFFILSVIATDLGAMLTLKGKFKDKRCLECLRF
ncbi:MAG: hypothetical protein AB1589_23850 [Cyanobacteriota bacterium]